MQSGDFDFKYTISPAETIRCTIKNSEKPSYAYTVYIVYIQYTIYKKTMFPKNGVVPNAQKIVAEI